MTLRDLLTLDHANSRFIYLFTSAMVCLCVLVLVVAFIFAQRQEYYPEMIGILLTGGVGGAAGRWLTSKKTPGVGGSTRRSETTTATTVEKVVKE